MNIPNSIIKAALFIIITLILIAMNFIWDLSQYFNPDQIESWLASSGSLAPFLYVVIMALAVVISPLPSLPLDIAAGAYFGTVPGTIYSVTGASIGAVISFTIARILGRELIERFLGGHINFCTSCSDKVLTKIVFLSRLMPFVSFDIISYGSGLTKMSLRKFTIATILGMIPLTFIYNYSGAILVFGKGLTFVLGIIMVALFFIIPGWIERKGFMKSLKH